MQAIHCETRHRTPFDGHVQYAKTTSDLTCIKTLSQQTPSPALPYVRTQGTNIRHPPKIYTQTINKPSQFPTQDPSPNANNSHHHHKATTTNSLTHWRASRAKGARAKLLQVRVQGIRLDSAFDIRPNQRTNPRQGSADSSFENASAPHTNQSYQTSRQGGKGKGYMLLMHG